MGDKLTPEGEALLKLYTPRKRYLKEIIYQSYEPFGIVGRRPTISRIPMYGIREKLRADMHVLEIGCSVGFLSCSLAPDVRTWEGVDIDHSSIRVARKMAKILKLDNTRFYRSDIKRWRPERMYDLIVSLAVHKHVGELPEAYGQRLFDWLKPGGLLLLESHDLNRKAKDLASIDKDFASVVEGVLSAGFVLLGLREMRDDSPKVRAACWLRRAA